MNLYNLLSSQGFLISFCLIVFITIFLLFKFKKIKVKIYKGEITLIENFFTVTPISLSPSFPSEKNTSIFDYEEDEEETISPFISFFKPSEEYIEDVTEVKIHGKKVRTNFKINLNNIEEMCVGNKINIIYIYFFGKKLLFNK